MADFNDGDGYNSDFTANTQNSEGTFQCNANSTMFDAISDNNSSGGILEGQGLNVNATVARKTKPSILRGQQKKQFKLSEIPSGEIAKVMANKQLQVLDDDNNVSKYLTYSTKTRKINYPRCDSLVPEEEPVKKMHYKVNLSHPEEIE